MDNVSKYRGLTAVRFSSLDFILLTPSVSMESSLAETQDEMLQVLKEKMRLEGQLEALSLEATQVKDVLLLLNEPNL